MTQIVYISSPESQQIYVWRLDNLKSKLELIQIVHTPGHPQPIIIHPTRRILYVGVRPNLGIITYYITSSGSLQQIGVSKIFSSPTYLNINFIGTFLYCASYNFNSISIIAIDKSGIPDSSSIQVIEGLMGCHSINIDITKKLLWVPCLLEHSIRLFQIHDFDGILIPCNPDRILLKFGSGPRHMAFHNISRYAYVINELNGTIDVIKYNSKIKLAPSIIQTINIFPDNLILTKRFWSADIHITANNRWLYCCDRSTHIISCFKVLLTTKKLKFMYCQFTERQPRSFAIDNTGRFLIIAGQQSNHIALYQVQCNTGQLRMLDIYHSGKGPMWVSILDNTYNKCNY